MTHSSIFALEKITSYIIITMLSLFFTHIFHTLVVGHFKTFELTQKGILTINLCNLSRLSWIIHSFMHFLPFSSCHKFSIGFRLERWHGHGERLILCLAKKILSYVLKTRLSRRSNNDPFVTVWQSPTLVSSEQSTEFMVRH